MLYKLKWTTIPILFVLLFSAPVRASNQTDPPGHILGGSMNSPVRIEIYSNFECTACREYYLRTIKRILKEYSSENKVCVVYHDFPFSYHKYDREAARYAEAASRISREVLIKVFDTLYTDQANWSRNGQLEETLKKVLSKENFEELMQIARDPEIERLIDEQYNMAIENGLNATPTSLIHYTGKQQKVEGLITYIVLKGFIDKIVE